MKRFGLILLGVLLPLVLIEVVLQLSSSLYRRALLGSRSVVIDPAKRRILCIGDSNTYGVHCAAGDSYPGQLQSMLDACAPPEDRWQVVNRGVPGRNTAGLLAELRERIDAIDPEIVIVLGGVNNTWNAAGDGQDEGFLAGSRLLRLVRIAVNDLRAGRLAKANTGAPEIAAIEWIRPSDKPGESQLLEQTRRDLAAIVELCRARGTLAVLMTYPGQHPLTRPMDEAAREVAREVGTGCLLVDHDPRFREYVARYGFEALLFEDSHPAEAGYTLMARDILEALSVGGAVRAELPADRYEPTEFRKPATIELTHDPLGAPATLRLEAEPLGRFQVYLSPVREPKLDLSGRKVPIGRHPALDACKRRDEFRGVLDAAGRSEVALPSEIRSLRSGEVLYAVFVTDDPRFLYEGSVRSISPVIEIRRRAPRRPHRVGRGSGRAKENHRT